LILILFFNLGGTIQSGLKNPPGLTTQFDPVTQIDQNDMDELIGFLKSREELLGYTNYWVSYPLAFLSAEEIIYLPRLPYHEDFRYTSRDDRYPPYREQIKKAQQIAYITTNHPELDSYLRSNFEDQGITWKEILIGDFQIFYDLSAVVRPQDIGLGRTTNP
jgi:hypothetical protein